MKRIISALLLIILFAIPVIIGPGWVFFIAANIVIYIGLYEFYKACLDPGSYALGWVGSIGITPLMWSAYFVSFSFMYYSMISVSLVIILLGLYLFEKQRTDLRNIVFALSGLIYPTGILCFWILVRNGIDGKFWMIFGLLCTFVSDVGAYYFGKSLGRHKIAPILSPKKSWEGVAGGVLTSILSAVLFVSIYLDYFHLSTNHPLWIYALLAGCITFLDLLGDLIASMVKRDRKIKDMGNLIPGHGGMLDRMDGIIPVGLVLYFVIQALY